MQLPPLSVMRSLVQRYARLQVALGDEFGDRPLVLPNSEFFPDPFRPDQKGVNKLVSRMRKQAGIDDIPLWTKLVQIDGVADACGCGTGKCPTDEGKKQGGETCSGGGTKTAPEDFVRLVDEGEGWRLNVPDIEVTHPVVLTCNVARALGHVFLRETQEEDRPIDEPVEITAELASVALGFGVLLMEGSYIYSKSCGGPRIARVTLLGPAELGVLTALFIALGGHSARDAKRELGATQRAALGEAVSWTHSNRALVQTLAERPKRLVDGKFDVVESKPWLARVFGSKKPAAADEMGDMPTLEELEQMLAMSEARPRQKKKPRDPKHDELKSLVEEALDEA